MPPSPENRLQSGAVHLQNIVPKVLLAGLGKINLGLMGSMFHQAGFEVSGVNFRKDNDHIVRALNESGYYVVHEREGRNRRDVHVDFKRAYMFDGENADAPGNREAVQAGMESHVIVSGVGHVPEARRRCVEFIKRVFEHRIRYPEGGSRQLDICGCENPEGLMFATAQLRDHLYDSIVQDPDERRRQSVLRHISGHVRFPLLLVDRICSERLLETNRRKSRSSGEDGAHHVAIVTESYKNIRCSDNSYYIQRLAHVFPKEEFSMNGDLETYRLLKLNVFNCAHALAAYYGALEGLETMDQAACRTHIIQHIVEVLEQVSEALKHRGGLPLHIISEYQSAVLPRIRNVLGDRLPRVARNPLRKLHRYDRLLGSALLVLYNSCHVSEELAHGIAAAFAYALQYDPENPKMHVEQGESDDGALLLKQRLLSKGNTTDAKVEAMREVLYKECAVRDPSRDDREPGGYFERLLVDRIEYHFRQIVG